MQGFILNVVKVKDEDLIVTLLTKKRLKTLYRFYGVRHSVINIGYKIDFIDIYNTNTTIGMLREVIHLGESWQFDRDKFYHWQQFMKLLNRHLRDVEEVDEFYFNLLQKASKKMSKQNHKRVLIESYVELLEFEGRLHKDFYCFICDKYIEKEVVLKRALLPSHYYCLSGRVFLKDKIKYLFENKNTVLLNNHEIDELWEIVLEGL